MTEHELERELQRLVNRALPDGTSCILLSGVKRHADGGGEAAVTTFSKGDSASQLRTLRFRHGPDAARLVSLEGFTASTGDVPPAPDPYAAPLAELRAAAATSPLKSPEQRFEEQWKVRRARQLREEGR